MTLITTVGFCGSGFAEEPPLPRLNVVLYTAADVAAPDGVHQRLTAVADYTERFLVQGLKQWGYPPAREQIFDREKDGQVRLYRVAGTLRAAAVNARTAQLPAEVWNTVVPKYSLGRHRHVWWIWVYLGSSNRLIDYRGFGDSIDGGAALVNYSDQMGEIKMDADMAADFHAEFTLKGCIHELGHAFGLSHAGPKRLDTAGMSLMGGTIDVYRRRVQNSETRVELLESSAAMLWKHPIFSGTTRDRGRLPSVRLDNLVITSQAPADRLVLSGRLHADRHAHSVIVADDAPPTQTDYWRKTYTARVKPDGEFDVAVDEPSGTDGTLKILFCFDNGVVTGDGKRQGLEGAIVRKYSFTHDGYRFDEPAANSPAD